MKYRDRAVVFLFLAFLGLIPIAAADPWEANLGTPPGPQRPENYAILLCYDGASHALFCGGPGNPIYVQGGGGGGGGGPVTIVDGGDVTLGAQADPACASDIATCSAMMLFKRENQRLTSILTALGSPMQQTGGTVQLIAGSALIGHVITDTGSTTVVTGNVAVTTADGANATLGAKTDARSTATDSTAATEIQILKEISFMEQTPAARAVTAIANGFADGAITTLGLEADTACTTDNGACTLEALIKRLNQRLTTLNTTMNSPFQTGGNIGNAFALDATLSTTNTDLGAPGATACATDTSSCSANALLQRIAQRLSSAITALGSPLQTGGTVVATGNVAVGSADDTTKPVKAAAIAVSAAPAAYPAGTVQQFAVTQRGGLLITTGFSTANASQTGFPISVFDYAGNTRIPASGNFLSDGANEQVQTQVISGTNSTGTGIAAAGILAQFDDTSPVACTENNFCNLRMSQNRNLYGTIRDAAGNERGANVDSGNNLQVTPGPSTANGWTKATITLANSTNATNLVVGVHTLGHISGYGVSATPIWVSFYDTAGTPTCGTSIAWQMLIPANSTSGAGAIEDVPSGLNFSSGIGFCATTGIAGTGSVAASSYVVNFGYK